MERDQGYSVVVDGVGRVIGSGNLGLKGDFGEEVLQGGLLVGHLKIGGDANEFLYVIHPFEFVFVLGEHILVFGVVVD